MKNILNLASAKTRRDVRHQHQGVHRHRSLDEVLFPIDELLKNSPNLVRSREARFERGGKSYFLPRYSFIGPQDGDEPLRVGIFAGVSGDERKAACAAIRLLKFLETYPEMAEGYYISVYPVCNPAGFEEGAGSSGGVFTSTLSEDGPEAALVQSETVAHSFHLILSLHVDNSLKGFFAWGNGTILATHLILPALKAVETFLPLENPLSGDFLPSLNSSSPELFPPVLRAPAGVQPRPFEIVLKAPQHRSLFLTEWASVTAVQSILIAYRQLIAHARNL